LERGHGHESELAVFSHAGRRQMVDRNRPAHAPEEARLKLVNIASLLSSRRHYDRRMHASSMALRAWPVSIHHLPTACMRKNGEFRFVAMTAFQSASEKSFAGARE